MPIIDDKSFKWLMLSAPYVREDYNDSFFVEYLDELKDKGDAEKVAEYIGKIYLKMLERVTPDFDQAHIRSTLEFLYNAGAAVIANRICNTYGGEQQHFLRDIYVKYNESGKA